MDCQNNTVRLQRMKNTQSKIKQSAEKNPGKTHCIWCKGYTNNFKPQEVKMKIKCLEKNRTILFVDLVNQDF